MADTEQIAKEALSGWEDATAMLTVATKELRRAKRALALVRVYHDAEQATIAADKLSGLDDAAFNQHVEFLTTHKPIQTAPRATSLPDPPSTTDLPAPARVHADVTEFMDDFFENPANQFQQGKAMSNEPKTKTQADIAAFMSQRLGGPCDDD